MSKKVLLISEGFYGQIDAGAEYQLYLIGSYLRDRGFQITFLFMDDGSPVRNDYSFPLIKIKKRILLRKVLGKYYFMDARKVYTWLERENPDFILINSGFAYVGIAAKYCMDNGCKLIWQIASQNDVEPFEFSLKRTILFDYIDKKFLEFGIKNAHYIIGQASYQNDLLTMNYGRKCDLIIPNFHPRPKEKIAKTLPMKIVWVANFKRVKQPEIFVKVAEKFRLRNHVKFIMIGNYEEKSDWQMKLISAIRRAENIEFAGKLPLDKVNHVLTSAHVFVNTSRYEGLPNTFVQAWMRKVPVVSLNVNPDDMITANKIGLHSGTFEQMVRDVDDLITHEEERKEMGERARIFAFKNFSMDNIEKIAGLIDKV